MPNSTVTFLFSIGDRVRDTQTGYVGVVTGLVVWRDGAHGCAVTQNTDKGQNTEWINDTFLTLD